MTYGLYKAVIETQNARMSLYSYGDNEEEIEGFFYWRFFSKWNTMNSENFF